MLDPSRSHTGQGLSKEAAIFPALISNFQEVAMGAISHVVSLV